MKSIVGVLIALTLTMPSVAFAKKICVIDNYGVYWIFPKVAKLKPGKVVPLSGVFQDYNAPVSGTALMTSAGAVNIGLFVHSMAPFDGNNATVSIAADGDFNGTGKYDTNGDYVSDVGITWINVDCDTAPPF